MDLAPRTPVSRRRILLGLGGLVLTDAIGVAGCTTTVAPATGSTGGFSAPDTAAARGAIARATSLAAAYRTAAGRHPSLRFLFDPLRAHHEVAVSTLGAQVPAAVPMIPAAGAAGSIPATSAPVGPTPAGPTPAGTATAGTATAGTATAGTATATAVVDESPTAHAATLASLRAAESSATAATRTDSLHVSSVLAPLLASLHAAGVAQVELLDLYGAQVGAGWPAATAGSAGSAGGVG